MDNLVIKRTKTTPEIIFDQNSNILKIAGESYPENSAGFYAPVFEWLEKYLKSAPKFVFEFYMIYFNTSSSKAIMDIIDLLDDYYIKTKNVELKWFYDEGDDDIQESGEEFTEDLEIPCQIIEK